MQFRELIMRLSYENMNELLKLCKVKSFVCFKGRYQGFPGSPLCLTDMSVFAEIPKVVNSLCTIDNSVLGIRTRKQYLFDS